MTDKNSIWLYGAGGHALVVGDVVRAMGRQVLGVFDDDPNLVGTGNPPIQPGLKIVAPNQFAQLKDPVVVSIGHNRTRQSIANQLPDSFFTAIHPSAQVSPSATVGPGSVVFHNAVVQAAAIIGRHAIINTAASVDHNCVIGDFAHIAPNVTLCGDVSVGQGAMIGAAAVVIPGIKIGAWSVVGAGAVVIRDVPERATVVGNPAIERREARGE